MLGILLAISRVYQYRYRRSITARRLNLALSTVKLAFSLALDRTALPDETHRLRNHRRKAIE